MNPNQARIRCVCGNVVAVKLGGKKRCKCGAMLRAANRDYLGNVTPWAHIAEDNLTQRKQAGKVIKHRKPKITGWIWG